MSLTDALLLDPLGTPRMDVWIALRTDGAKGSGTEDDPYDGSTITTIGYPISSLAHAGKIATAVCVGHPFVEGGYVLVSGVKGTASNPALGGFFNGVFKVDAVATDLFRYTMYAEPPEAPTDFSMTAARLEPYRFDAVMRSLRPPTTPPPVTVHIGPGIFETKGYSNLTPGSWSPSSGMRVVGSGINLTTLKLVGVTVPDAMYHVIGGAYNNYLTGFEVSDLMIDCNLPGQALEPSSEFPYAPVVCGAINVTGCHIRVRRIRAIRWGTQTNTECFVIVAATSHPEFLAEVFDCVIEDCVCDKPSQENYRETTVLHMGGGEAPPVNAQKFTRAVVLRNNFVDCGFANGAMSFIITSNEKMVWVEETPGSGLGLGTFVGKRAHDRVPGQYVRLIGPMTGPTTGWNGYFKIRDTPTSDTLVLEMPDPGGVFPDNTYATIGTQFNALSMGACVCGVVAGNFVQNAWIGGPYQDTYHTRDITIRNNRYRNVVAGAYWLLGKNGGTTSVNLSRTGGFVTASTGTDAHLLIKGDRIHVPTMGFDGYFELLSVISPTVFTYADSRAYAPTTPGLFERVWGVDRILVEGNSYELADLKNGEWGAPPIAISIVDGSPTLITSPPPYVHQEIVVRGNRVRYTDGAFASDYAGYGIALLGAAKAIVEENVIHSADADPIKFARCGQVRCQNNSTPGGMVIRGINLSNLNAKYDDLATRIEDAMVAAFL